MDTYPIDKVIPDLRKALERRNAAVLSAPPGAGKTTRVPIALLDMIPEGSRIVMLEPRRIAAASAARWMAGTMGEEVGETVGYAIRFERKASRKTRIEVVTEGILTRRIQSDPELAGVSVVIFDEFHERSIHADLALALCLDVRKALRPDLRVLVMSATLDCGPIASLLGEAPVVKSGGRTFPVGVHHVPGRRRPLTVQVAEAVSLALKETPGDILVFLPGYGEIAACSEALRQVLRPSAGVTIHPLFGDLPFEEQEKAILPSENRRVVLATNIAETSLTIEGVRVVIDSGLTRRLQYDPGTGMNRLVTISASRASADQRKGRAGRTGPGACYRLYSAGAYQAMQPFSPPEIMVSDLSSLVLELSIWGVRDHTALSWLTPPPAASWESAVNLLRELGAIDQTGGVTMHGRRMAGLPVHPRLAALIVRAEESGVARLGADLAALLSERDIVRRASETDSPVPRDADLMGRLVMLESWRRHRHVPAGADNWALRAVDRVSRQLRQAGGGKMGKEGHHDPDEVARLLLSAFPDRIARLRPEGGGRYLLSTGRGVRLADQGGLSGSPYLLALRLDAGTGAEGLVHLAAPLTEEQIRQECGKRIDTLRRVEWDQRQGRVIATQEERLGALVLGDRPFTPSDEDALPILCDAIRSGWARPSFGEDVRQFQGRVFLMKRYFADEEWPDLSEDRLLSVPERWLLPWLSGLRTSRRISGLDILPALKMLLSREQMKLLDRRAPISITVPSGRTVRLDYTAGDVPVLAVKLQEMFGLADAPAVADGRVKVVLHLLSPAMRPVQVTQDLRGFWNSGYQQVRKELRGRYPKHPWPDDPWKAAPTARPKKGRPSGS